MDPLPVVAVAGTVVVVATIAIGVGAVKVGGLAVAEVEPGMILAVTVSLSV